MRRRRIACVWLVSITSACGLVLDFDPEDMGRRDGGSSGPEIDAERGDMRRDPRRDTGPGPDALVVDDAGRDGETGPIDMGPIDAGCACDDRASSACVGGRCVCGAEDECGGSELCCAESGSIPSCIDPKTNDLHCGACGVVCGANARCHDGACMCEDGFADCDGEPGCEVALEEDPTHCGACFNGCDPTAPSCVDGACVSCESDSDCGSSMLRCRANPSCDVVNGTCVPGALDADACLIAGQCFDEAEANPATPCLVCAPTVDPFGWTAAAGQPCDDGRACTDRDVCDDDGSCVGEAQPCDDFVGCTLDFCDVATTGECQHEAMPGFCLDPRDPSMCIPAGMPLGTDLCRRCNGMTGTFEPAAAGASCDDNDRCNGRETCDAMGRCTAGVPAPACEAGLASCFVRECNAATGLCDRLRTGFCFIEGNCHPDGGNGDNPCQVCNSSVNAFDWTRVDNGTTCRRNATCQTGSCMGGTCVASSPPCTTSLNETCNPVTGICSCVMGFASCGAAPGDANGCECIAGACSGSICTMPAGG